MLDGKVLLITGGTGSFGNAVLGRFFGIPKLWKLEFLAEMKKNKMT
jgi:FlaA1/EpsC-like NDP-sugar epimerase